jgi:hypothetical protein
VGKVGLNALKMHLANIVNGQPLSLIYREGHFYERLTTMPEKFVLNMTPMYFHSCVLHCGWVYLLLVAGHKIANY